MTGDPFITPEELGLYLGGRNLTDDAMALAACTAACDACRTTTDQLFDEVEDDEVVIDGPGTDVMILPQVPVANVSSIVDYLGREVETDWVLTDKGTIVLTSGGVWRLGRQNFTVTYDHGFSIDESGKGFPQDLIMVALSMAGRIYMQGPVVFESLGKRSVRYAGPAMDFSKTERAILRKYKQTL